MKVVETFLGSDNIFSMSGFMVFDSYSPVEINLTVYIPHGLELRYPNFASSTLRFTLSMAPAGSGVKFPTPPSGTFPILPCKPYLLYLYFLGDPISLGGVDAVVSAAQKTAIIK